MTTKSSNSRAGRNSTHSVKSSEAPTANLIRADAFDRFIEEQLKRDVGLNDRSDVEIVCHAY